jgi:homoserine dehydrogenase/aspartokinase/homoserine dehydrogenase 1
LIDTTASDATLKLQKLALKRGGSVVMSNKKPVADKQSDFDALTGYGEGRVFFETSVGAGLPIIGTLRDLHNTGDTIEQITGCFSGTLGYIFTELEEGTPFSKAVAAAKSQGFTEPDPRDDLSGVDVARKAVILGRMMGRKLELKDVELQSLYPESMAKLPVEEFMKKLPTLDKEFAKGFKTAMGNDMIPRYIASVTPKKSIVGLAEVPFDSDIGALQGPDNIIVIQTKRYHDNPLVIKGPGAGVTVTAAGVFADVLKAAGAIS